MFASIVNKNEILPKKKKNLLFSTKTYSCYIIQICLFYLVRLFNEFQQLYDIRTTQSSKREPTC